MTVEGYFAAALVWYLLVTTQGVLFGLWFNYWIQTPRGRATATCYQVAIGVIATEILRVVRAFPLVCVLAQPCYHGLDWWIVPVILFSAWILDALSAYAATGLPMIHGDLKRRADARADGSGAIVAEATSK